MPAGTCRDHARRCFEKAKRAKSPELRELLISLGRTYISLALTLEHHMGIADQIDGHARRTIVLFPPPSPTRH